MSAGLGRRPLAQEREGVSIRAWPGGHPWKEEGGSCYKSVSSRRDAVPKGLPPSTRRALFSCPREFCSLEITEALWCSLSPWCHSTLYPQFSFICLILGREALERAGMLDCVVLSFGRLSSW